jgi:hypothetical protein
MQENNEMGGKFLECGRVLDFAVCLRLLEREVSLADQILRTWAQQCCTVS